MIFLVYMLIGAFAGIASGLFGLGGGAVVIPGLLFVFSRLGFPSQQLMHLAIGTSLAAMIVTATFSAWSHWRRGVEIKPLAKLLLPGAIVGTVLGALSADRISSHILQVNFGFFVLLAAVKTFTDTKPQGRFKLPGKTVNFGIEVFVGAISGFLGIGGGVMNVPYLTICRVDMRQAVAVATTVGFAIAIVGTLSYIFTGLNEANLPPWTTGYVYWPGVLGMVLASPFFAFLGAQLAHKLPIKTLKRCFGVPLLLIAIRMLVK